LDWAEFWKLIGDNAFFVFVLGLAGIVTIGEMFAKWQKSLRARKEAEAKIAEAQRDEQWLATQEQLARLREQELRLGMTPSTPLLPEPTVNLLIEKKTAQSQEAKNREIP
jgi:hypothetical protein